MRRTAAAKPCPFCGSTNVEKFDYPFKSNRMLNGCFVYCMACGARCGKYRTIDDAVNAWNTRKDAEQ